MNKGDGSLFPPHDSYISPQSTSVVFAAVRQRALSPCSRSVSDARREAAASRHGEKKMRFKNKKKVTHTVLLSSSAESRDFQPDRRSVPRCACGSAICVCL